MTNRQTFDEAKSNHVRHPISSNLDIWTLITDLNKPVNMKTGSLLFIILIQVQIHESPALGNWKCNTMLGSN